MFVAKGFLLSEGLASWVGEEWLIGGGGKA
jgi:hypothetical protein